MPEQSNDYRVVVFGAGGVGKSSLVLRFVRGTFRDTYVPTIEDTYRQVISCNKQVSVVVIGFELSLKTYLKSLALALKFESLTALILIVFLLNFFALQCSLIMPFYHFTSS